MSLRRIIAPALVLVLACGSDHRPTGSNVEGEDCLNCAKNEDTAPLGGAGGLMLNSGPAGNNTPSGGGGGGSGAGFGSLPEADAGLVAPEPVAECGNNVREGSEECDGADFGGLSCATFGFSEGAVVCGDSCAVDSSACTGVEVCSDGRDNDGDSLIDCQDDNCLEACEDPCADPRTLPDGTLLNGQLLQHSLGEASSCADNPTGGGQVVFLYEPALTGVAEITLFSNDGSLSLSLRNQCTDTSLQELECGQAEPGSNYSVLEVEVTLETPAYIVVESGERQVAASFQLVATSREVICSDGYIDGSEQCDDGNYDDGDGCSSECVFQPNEAEPNANLNQANTYTDPGFVGVITNVQDVDTVSIEVPAGGTLVAETSDLGDGQCLRNELDNRLTIFNSQGEVMATDDDSGIGYCAAAIATDLSAGEYFVSLTASGASQSFAYRLRLRLR